MTTQPTLLSAYLQKLESRKRLPEQARQAFLSLPYLRRTYEPYADVIRERDRPERSSMVETGLVSRYKTLRDGSRQILSFHIPGDMVDLASALVVVADHGIRTQTKTTIASVAHHDLLDVAAQFPDLGRALWFDTLIDAAIFREWTTNIGRRSTRVRTAHLFCELVTKYREAGLITDYTIPFPIVQADLSDALGVTSVHLNRTLQWMRGERYIRTHGRTLEIENWPAMVELAGFEPAYLHPEGPRSELEEYPHSDKDGNSHARSFP